MPYALLFPHLTADTRNHTANIALVTKGHSVANAARMKAACAWTISHVCRMLTSCPRQAEKYLRSNSTGILAAFAMFAVRFAALAVRFDKIPVAVAFADRVMLFFILIMSLKLMQN